MDNEIQPGPVDKNEREKRWIDAVTGGPLKFGDIVAAASGVVAGGKKEAVLSLGRVVQAASAGKFHQQLNEEFEGYIETGRVKSDYDETPQCWDCLREALKAIDNGVDEEQFKAIRDVFLGIATEKTTKRDEVVAYEILKLVATLDSMEVIVMRAIWRESVIPAGVRRLTKEEQKDAMYDGCCVPKKHAFLVNDAILRLNKKGILGAQDIANVASWICEDKPPFSFFGIEVCKLLVHRNGWQTTKGQEP